MWGVVPCLCVDSFFGVVPLLYYFWFCPQFGFVPAQMGWGLCVLLARRCAFVVLCALERCAPLGCCTLGLALLTCVLLNTFLRNVVSSSLLAVWCDGWVVCALFLVAVKL